MEQRTMPSEMADIRQASLFNAISIDFYPACDTGLYHSRLFPPFLPALLPIQKKRLGCRLSAESELNSHLRIMFNGVRISLRLEEHRDLSPTRQKRMWNHSFAKSERIYCNEMGKDPEVFLKDADMPDIKTYWEWVVDRYPKIRAGSSLKNYWRTLHIRNHLTSLQKAHSFRVHPLPKSVLNNDAVYRLLYILWVLDESIYPDKRQRVQDSAAMLMSTFFGCRLTFIFDTRVKLDSLDPNTASLSDAGTTLDEEDDDDDIGSEGSVTDDDCLAGED
ncbi:hypothetical protein MMC10_010982 [Thelotrema lepadinum]|nr:hypothetical protein [Thelotrema lepadinum]